MTFPTDREVRRLRSRAHALSRAADDERLPADARDEALTLTAHAYEAAALNAEDAHAALDEVGFIFEAFGLEVPA